MHEIMLFVADEATTRDELALIEWTTVLHKISWSNPNEVPEYYDIERLTKLN